ncbi:iron oxidase [Methylocystis sp. MitZ-2018]|nr:iron oxidase [Methylocystis sp. MitZ-2018]
MTECLAPTRRSLILLLCAAAAGLSTTSAQAKSSKSAAAYRGAPNGRQSCANCSWFNAPSGCGMVSGPVSARGWCNLWG